VLPIAEPAAYERRYAEDDKASSSLAATPAVEWPVDYWTVDAAFITMTLLLCVADASLGALFFQLQGREGPLMTEFEIPSDRTLIGAVAIGRPRQSVEEGAVGVRETRLRRNVGARRDRSEMIHPNRW
jgi:hypothetical protein